MQASCHDILRPLKERTEDISKYILTGDQRTVFNQIVVLKQQERENVPSVSAVCSALLCRVPTVT